VGQNLHRLGADRRDGEKVSIIADQLKGRIDIKGAGGIRDLATVRALYQLGVRRFGMSHGAVTRCWLNWSSTRNAFPS
jgi:deoxyribose-phosphate aldolase